MTVDIEKLKALALAAGGEEWRIKENLPDYEVMMGDDFMVDTAYYPVAPEVEKARYIAAANPAAVLDLIAEVERLRAATQPAPIPALMDEAKGARLEYVLAHGGPMNWLDNDGRDVWRYAKINAWSTSPIEAIDAAIASHINAGQAGEEQE